jgi:hypothetical protein
MWWSLGGALLASLGGAPHCVGMCGGFAGAVSERPQWTAAWHAGRITTYVVLGATAGAIGHQLPTSPAMSAALSAGLLLVFALGLTGWLPAVHPPAALVRLAGRLLSARARMGAPGTFAFGAVNGLLPCGLTHTALAVPVASGDPRWGGAWMLLFGLGTVPALLVARVGLRRVLDARPWVRPLVATAVLLSGLYAIQQRAAPPTPDGVPPCHAAPVGGPQGEEAHSPM